MYDIVVISGGFDPPHVGHFRMALASSELGERVIVGVNSDEWLKRKKGYVFMPWAERAEMMCSVKGVDSSVKFDDSDNTASDLLRAVRKENPDASICFANGGDRVGNNTPEQSVCLDLNIDMVWSVGGGKVQSSSDLVKMSLSSKPQEN